jgi:hypothetical protein
VFHGDTPNEAGDRRADAVRRACFTVTRPVDEAATRGRGARRDLRSRVQLNKVSDFTGARDSREQA